MTLPYRHRFMVAAHRGDSYNCFENTMSAFHAALAAGVDMIETDVRLSRDLEMVLIHDETVDRTANGTGKVREMTFEQLRALNVGSENQPEQIPTLDEFFALMASNDVMINLEFKEYFTEGNEARCHDCIDRAIALAEAYGLTDRMVFNSFDAHVLQYIFERYGGKYMLHGFYPYDLMKNVDRNPDEFLYCACVFQYRVSAHFTHLREKGIEAWIGASITSAPKLAQAAQYGAMLVTTNYPADTIEKLNQLKLR